MPATGDVMSEFTAGGSYKKSDLAGQDFSMLSLEGANFEDANIDFAQCLSLWVKLPL